VPLFVWSEQLAHRGRFNAVGVEAMFGVLQSK